MCIGESFKMYYRHNLRPIFVCPSYVRWVGMKRERCPARSALASRCARKIYACTGVHLGQSSQSTGKEDDHADTHCQGLNHKLTGGCCVGCRSWRTSPGTRSSIFSALALDGQRVGGGGGKRDVSAEIDPLPLPLTSSEDELLLLIIVEEDIEVMVEEVIIEVEEDDAIDDDALLEDAMDDEELLSLSLSFCATTPAASAMTAMSE